MTRQADPFVWHSFSRHFLCFPRYLLMMQSLVTEWCAQKEDLMHFRIKFSQSPSTHPVFHSPIPLFCTGTMLQRLLNINTPPALFSLQLEHEYWLPACLSRMGTEHPKQPNSPATYTMAFLAPSIETTFVGITKVLKSHCSKLD